MNLFAGRNNAGKSNVLRFAQTVLSGMAVDSNRLVPPLDALDLPSGAGGPANPDFAIAVGQDTVESVVNRVNGDVRDAIRQVLATEAFRLTDDDLVWVRFQIDTGPRRLPVLVPAQLAAAQEQLIPRWRTLLAGASSTLTGSSGGAATDDLGRIVASLKVLDTVPTVSTIEAFRQVRDAGELSYSGDGLIERLAQLQDPDVSRLDDRSRFAAIVNFVRSVLDDADARISIPFRRNTIHVHQDGLELPLENVGTGLHEVIMIAAAATLLQEQVVCIEEPEVHLHPVLQRKLLRYLVETTSNQYLVATHSAHLLDTEIATVFHVKSTIDGSHITRATTGHQLASICADLGYRPSDLLQSNCIVWVEGPSDRIYLRNWIQSIDSTLIEGIHYSIMFYGGRLLNHLSADDPEIEDFISLRRLNRNIGILIDSDKTSSRKPINATKQRVSDELASAPGVAWVTAGYCIENYVPEDVLGTAVDAVHSGVVLDWSGERYRNPFEGAKKGAKGVDVDKVRVARRVVEVTGPGTPWTYDLMAEVGRVVGMIRIANGVSVN